METKKYANNKVVYISATDIDAAKRGEFSEQAKEYMRNALSKPGWNDVKKETMLAMREKHHMTNMEIAKACNVSRGTVVYHLGRQDKALTNLSFQKRGKKQTVDAEYKWEQEFNALQEERKNNPHAHTVICEMCGRKFYGLRKNARFCKPCMCRRTCMIAQYGMTAAQIDEQIKNRKKAQQVLSLIQQATEVAATITDKDVLTFPIINK